MTLTVRQLELQRPVRNGTAAFRKRLLKLGYNIIPQQKIGRYKVDFAIPDQKLVIEVDGELYHGCEGEGKREATIQISLGFAWKIIHVPAEWIEKDIRKLKKVIEASTCNTRGKNL